MSGDVIPLMLFVAQDGRCFHCEVKFHGKGFGARNTMAKLWTRDHVQLAHQGNGRAFNTVLACGRCNLMRGARPPTPVELTKAFAIFDKVRILWRGFYGETSPVWPDKSRQEMTMRRAWEIVDAEKAALAQSMEAFEE